MKLLPLNFLKKQPTPNRKKDTSKNIERWEVDGGNNNFPQQLLQNVHNSPIGSSAIDVWHEFTNGDGFVEEELNNLKVNKSQTLKDLNQKLSADISSMEGVAIIVRYNLNGEKTEYHHLPFESARLGELNDKGIADKIYYNPYYGTKDYNEEFTKWYYTYNPDGVLEEIRLHNEMLNDNTNKDINFAYPGQVFWFSIEKPLARVYPQPFYYSAINWFQVDASVALFHNRNIDNNFLLNAIMNVFGDPDQPAGDKDKDGNYTSTAGEEFEKDMRELQGADNAGGILLQWIRTKDEATTITPFPSNINDDLFVTLQNLVTDQIAIGTKVPRVLLNIGQSGKLGDTQEILNAITLMQGTTKRLRNVLSSIYSKIFAGYSKEGITVTLETDFTIKNINPVDLLPSWAVDVMSDEEKRTYLNEHYNVSLEVGETDQLTIEENGG